MQISALGDPADGECIASKHHLDDALQSLPLALLVPVHRPECLLVFVLGTTVGFGTMLPTLFGSLMALATVVIHRFIGMPLQRLVGLQKATSPQGLE